MSLKQDYLNNPGACPYCKSNQLDFEEYETVYDGSVRLAVSCDTCGGTWTDVYQLIDVILSEERR